MVSKTSSMTRSTAQGMVFLSPSAAGRTVWERMPTVRASRGMGRPGSRATPQSGRRTRPPSAWAGVKFLQPESRAADSVPGAWKSWRMGWTELALPPSRTQTFGQLRQASPRSWVTQRMGPGKSSMTAASSSSSWYLR